MLDLLDIFLLDTSIYDEIQTEKNADGFGLDESEYVQSYGLETFGTWKIRHLMTLKLDSSLALGSHSTVQPVRCMGGNMIPSH